MENVSNDIEPKPEEKTHDDGGAAGAWSVRDRAACAGVMTCLATALVSAEASAPLILAKSVWP